MVAISAFGLLALLFLGFAVRERSAALLLQALLAVGWVACAVAMRNSRPGNWACLGAAVFAMVLFVLSGRVVRS